MEAISVDFADLIKCDLSLKKDVLLLLLLLLLSMQNLVKAFEEGSENTVIAGRRSTRSRAGKPRISGPGLLHQKVQGQMGKVLIHR